MVAANQHCRGQVHGVAVIYHQLGRFGSNVHHGDALAPVLRQHGRIGRGQRLEDGLVHHQVGLVHRADQRVMLLHRSRHQVDVDFQLRCQHLSGVVVAGVAIHHEILREQLQNHAVRRQLHAGGAVHHSVHVALLDLPQVSQLHQAAAAGAAHRVAAHPHHHRLDGDSGIRLRLVQRCPDGIRHRSLVGDLPLQPAFGRDGGGSQQAHAALLESANHQPCFAAARVETRCVNRFLCHNAVNP